MAKTLRVGSLVAVGELDPRQPPGRSGSSVPPPVIEPPFSLPRE